MLYNLYLITKLRLQLKLSLFPLRFYFLRQRIKFAVIHQLALLSTRLR